MAYDHATNQISSVILNFDNGDTFEVAIVEDTFQEQYGQVNTENLQLAYKGTNWTNVNGISVDPSGFSSDIMSMKDQPFTLLHIQKVIEKTMGKCNIILRFSPTSKQKSYQLKFATVSMQGAGNNGRANRATLTATGTHDNIVI